MQGNPIVSTIIFLIFAIMVLALPFIMLILGLVVLKSPRVSTSRLFDAGIHLATLVAVIPAILFLWFVPTIAFIIAFVSQQYLEPSVRMVVAIFAIIGIAFQIMFVRDTIRYEMRDKGLTLTQYIKRSFSREYKEQVRREREATSQKMDELYSKLDDITARPWARRQREAAERAKAAELKSAAMQKEKLTAEYQAEPFITKSSLITISLSVIGTTIIVFLIGVMVGLENLLAQDRDTIFAFGNFTFLVGGIMLIFGAISVLGVQRSRSAAVSLGAIAAGVSNKMVDQAAKDIGRWSYTNLAGVSVIISGLLIVISIILTVIYFPQSLLP